jgi:PPOX class probable F420-dependent enzyme
MPVQLDVTACWVHLRAARHGVLGTVHATRGVDAVPVVFVLDGEDVVIPIDAVKPKAGQRLQRLRNLDTDARAVLLVDRYDDDWSKLWWVRVHGGAIEAAPTTEHLKQLATTFPAYAAAGTVTSVIVLTPSHVTGWAGEASTAHPLHG